MMLLTETRRKEQGDGALKAEMTLARYVLSHFLRKTDVEVVLPFLEMVSSLTFLSLAFYWLYTSMPSLVETKRLS